VVEGVPHHITQRGNRRQQTFFCVEDYSAYLELMAEWCGRCGVEIWAYCLMPNHVHLVAAPQREDGLRRGIGEAHRRYTRRVNFRERWRGHLWQERFASFPMDENYLMAAGRYVELNPVRAGLATNPFAYPWSSAAAHLRGEDDVLAKAGPLLERRPDWESFLAEGLAADVADEFRLHERTGRPLGGKTFVERLETSLGRVLHPCKPWEARYGEKL
jgi:putative transposase